MIIMYKEILKANPYCALSGSHALDLMGYKLRRLPSDIDIFCTDNDFKPIDGMIRIETDWEKEGMHPSSTTDEFPRQSYKINGIQVDVFYCKDRVEAIIMKSNFFIVNGIRCVDYLDILKFKLSYVNPNSSTCEKHKLDLLFFIENMDKMRSVTSTGEIIDNSPIELPF